jgi:hypothetical protein
MSSSTICGAIASRQPPGAGQTGKDNSASNRMIDTPTAMVKFVH